MERSASGSSRQATGASGRRARRIALAAAIAAALPHPAAALFNDRLELWAAQNVTHDSNVFRISDDLDPATIGAQKRGDTSYTTHLGATLRVPWSLQRFEADLDWYRTKYDTFEDLDFTGHRARLAWAYNVANRLTGVASINDTRGLSSFRNIQAREKDVVKARQADLTAAWLATPRWRVDGRVVAVETEHSNPLRKIDDIETAAVETGISYVTPRENLFGASARFERGRSPDGVPLTLFQPGVPTSPGITFDNKYRQWAAGVTATWIPTAHSRFDGRAEWLDRRYDQFTARNYRGPAMRAVYTWAPTVKTAIAFGALRDFAPPEEVQSSRVIVTGAYIRPKWSATEKITVQGNLEYNVWDYKGGVIAGTAGTHTAVFGDFEHRVRMIGASVQWQPLRRIWLNAGYNHEKRTSTLRFGDYDVDVVFVEGRIGF